MENVGDRKKELKPFGNPDGSRADIAEITSNFIQFGSEMWGGLATRRGDLTARVFAGKKGSGKTVYLRRMHAYAVKQGDLFADDIQQSLPTTKDIIKFCQLHDEQVLTEQWMLLWHRAFLRSIATHIVYNRKLRSIFNKNSLIEKYEIQKIDDWFKEYSPLFLRNISTPLSVYSQVNEIIQKFQTQNQFSDYLNHPLWAELEYKIADAINFLPPICFYIDAVDEEYAHAPMYWQRCQKGLFYQTMRFLRDSRLGGRLHIVICIRDNVLSSVYRSEHKTRYIDEPHIRILNWNKEAIEYFLNQKIIGLDKKYFMTYKENEKNLQHWLGMTEIYNDSRGINEPINQYLIRHTRLIPRDIVQLGNSLCDGILKIKENDNINLNSLIRQIVSDKAKIFGDEQLTICGNQLASQNIPLHRDSYEYSCSVENLHKKGCSDNRKI